MDVRLTTAVLALILSLGGAPARAADDADRHLGEVHFPISCSPAAQQHFDHAVAMLHSFSYPGTVEAFGAIAAVEPGCAMAYWGIAISQRPNPLAGPFPDANLKAGWDAIEKARAATRKTARESDWIEALAAFFQDFVTVDQQTRTRNYAAAMARLSARYPDDIEAAVFHALALEEAADLDDTTYANQLAAGAILEKLWPSHPHHPGIPHYLIHSYDYPPLAAHALEAARRYAELATSSVHALHMPSHIFSMLGHWREVIAQETRTSAAAIASYPEDAPEHREPWRILGRFHTLDFLVNAYLQIADDRHADEILAERNRLEEFPAAFRITGHTAYAAIPVRVAIERGRWAEAAALKVPRTPFPQAKAIAWFGRALGAARSANFSAAEADVAQLRRLEQMLIDAHDSYWAGQVEIEIAGASAWIDLGNGRRDEAIAAMRAAAVLDDRSEKHIAMENKLSPMRELLGELLLAANQPAAALPEFAAALRSTPNRYRSLADAANAAERSGDRQQAMAYYEKLVVLCGDAGNDRPELAAARKFLADN